MPNKFHTYIAILFFLFFVKIYSQNLELKVIGSDELETKVIDSIGYENFFKDYITLKIEIDSIAKRFLSIGHINSQLLKIKRQNDSLYEAKFSLKARYNSITIIHNGLIDKDILKVADIKSEGTSFTLPISKLENTLKFINTEIANRGKPFSTLQLKDIKKESDSSLSANLELSLPIERSIDKIIIKGYEKFPKTYIKHYMKIKIGQRFNLSRIKEKTSELNDLRFANQIKDPEVLFTKDSTILYMYIEKTKSNSFDGFLGFGTNEDTNKIEFDGYLNLSLTNNLNYGETLKLLYKSDENDQQTFDGNVTMPYMFGSPLGVEVNLNIFRKDSTFVTARQSAKLNYQINSNHLVSVGLSSVNSSDLLDTQVSSINDFNSSYYFTNYIYTKRQNYDFLFSVNFLFDITGGFGNRTFDDVHENQTKFTLNTYKIFNLNDRNSIYIRGSGQIIDSETFLENELPRFGGINSIRGFEENSLIANMYGVINTEYRYRLNRDIYVHSVIDAAYFENKISNQKGKLFGFGFGFGLLSKAGLFRFNYSSGKSENQQFKLSDSKVHLSLTATF
ncbi:outer membrane protein assembly factor [Psychroserpens ponticola]|uniref:Outer membrane protein assembly factor n=1 Tax=Psychroserpens ponticola TaxID=2932268 RepID=A0ABY7S344_9FLAO|nr:outer membrane protein assembly factor [Psychroserpens ponticola]WCO02340.1 outer membrane protein assembly factor [Psychroserpens ponticola]